MPPFRRRPGFALGAPKVVTFGLSLVLALLAVGSALTHYPRTGSGWPWRPTWS